MTASRYVALVVGPPAAGKTTWVQQHARPGDVVVDFDEIARRLGSRVEHGHTGSVFWRAMREQERLEARVARMASGRAFVIRTLPNPVLRARRARQLRATEVVVVDPGRDIVGPRARSLRPLAARAAVDDWYRFNPTPQSNTVDTVDDWR